MYNGFLQLGGTEIINSARTQAYVEKNMPGFQLRDCIDSEGLQEALGDLAYESPLVDDAPWMDHASPATMRFYGLYPLEIQGMNDSTASAEVIESITAGGAVGRSRSGTRQIRVRGLLIAHDDSALDAGMEWLKAALVSSSCGGHNGGSCGGAGLCYYNARPQIVTCYEDNYTGKTTTNAGSLSAASSPAILQLPPTAAMFRTEFKFAARDSMLVRWGAMSETSQDVLEEHGEIVSQRTNVVTNPSFHTNLAGWSVVSGAPGFTRVGAGGSDGGAYAAVTAGGSLPGVIRTATLSAAFGANIISFSMKSPNKWGVVARLRSSSDDSILASYLINTTQAWQRYSFTSGFGRNVYLTFEVGPTGIFHLDQVLLEAGAVLLPYFDARSNAQLVMDAYRSKQLPVEYENHWMGAADASASRMTWLGKYTEEWCEPRWRPFIGVRNSSVDTSTITYDYRREIPGEEQAAPYERYLHGVSQAIGPKVIRTYKPRTGAMQEVDFTLVSELPYVFSSSRFIAESDPDLALPWTDVVCTEEEITPIVDPDCPPLMQPPRPPAIANPCIDDPTLWKRTWVEVPETEVSTWADMVPIVIFNTRASATRQVRVRVFPNPFKFPIDDPTGEEDNYSPVDPCSWCSEFIISYIPPHTEMTIDGTTETAFAAVDGAAQQAVSNLLYGTGGVPMTWPVLTCGIPYAISIDTPLEEDAELQISFSLARRSG